MRRVYYDEAFVSIKSQMFEPVLQELQAKIRLQAYVVTIHADEEMDDDQLAIGDVEACILSGQIVERQRDRVTAENKYRVRGLSLDGLPMETVVKLGATGKLVIITVYAL
jgi:Domain of unknown function (DUF4258)